MIHISVRFALLLKDDFSGATIADGGQRFTVNGRPARLIRKPDGFFVFTAPPGPGPDPERSWDVCVESARHFPRRIRIEADDLPPGMPLRIVQMYRRPHSGFADCDWFEAKGPPGLLAAALYEGDPPLALNRFSAEGRGIYLRGFMAANLVWRRVCVGDGPQAELFTLTARHPDGGYELDRPLRFPWKTGTPVYLAACAPVREDGLCHIPVRPGWTEKQPQIRYYDEEAMQWQETWCAPARS